MSICIVLVMKQGVSFGQKKTRNQDVVIKISMFGTTMVQLSFISLM